VRLQPLTAPQHAVTKGEILYDALIVGGEDHRTGNPDHAEDRWDRLLTWARARWPQAQELSFAWSGQCLEPYDYSAFIGRNPDGAENVYMASGDSGQGMTHGVIAGMLLTDLILGNPNDWESVYDPSRVTIGLEPAKEFAVHNADVAYRFVKDYLVKGDLASETDIQPGEGRVVRRGAHKLAVFRDDSGTLHECSAVCTHLKCIVAWNATEKSWDCPCHGSRFDPYGKVLNGPAVSDLERME
jgi:nitrite reductase/ring-hydroxylating ferredoxin subunit